MPVRWDEHAKEEGSFLLTHTFLDLSGAAVVPNEASWTLTDKSGTVINDREDVVITIGGTDSTVSIVLQGDDLALPDPFDNLRIVTINAIYDDTGTSQNNLPYREEIRFYIDNLVKIS